MHAPTLHVTLLLCIVFCTGFAVASGHDGTGGYDCDRIPPTLYCKNENITEACGLTQLCNRYKKESGNHPVLITVIYESLCPDSQQFIIDDLYRDVYLQLGAYVEIELVPYGNAQRKNTTITCQHHEPECYINRYQSCAINFMPEPVPFIYCLEFQLQNGVDFEKATIKCYATYHVQEHVVGQIKECTNGSLGLELQMKAAERTENVWPEQHAHVPWLVFNNISLRAEQFRQRDLAVSICDYYVGDDLPEFCTGAGIKLGSACSKVDEEVVDDELPRRNPADRILV